MIMNGKFIQSLVYFAADEKTHKLALCRCGLQDLCTQVWCCELQVICPVIFYSLAQSRSKKSTLGNIFKKLPDGSLQAAWA